MMERPKDNETRKISSKGKAILHYRINLDCWEYKQETGGDVGRDCILELSENDVWCNHKVEGQIKGTSSPKITFHNQISFSMEVKTIAYALGTSTAFILFVVDTKTEMVYYQCIQKYFIENKDLFQKLETQKYITIHIPVTQNLQQSDELLQNWAKTTYIDGPGLSLREYRSNSTLVSA